MKLFFLIAGLSALALIALSEPAPPPPEGATLETLREEYARKRSDALRDVTMWYRAQLEGLERAATDAPLKVKADLAKAAATAREEFWAGDQPELATALIQNAWLWSSEDDSQGVAVTFGADGTVEHIGMRGTWRISGPCEVTIQTGENERFILRFNASLSAYEGDQQSVTGVRLKHPSAG